MVIFTAKFKKADGSVRTMKFCRLSDMPPQIASKKRSMINGKELVWDLDSNDYRYFNWNTVIGKATAKRA